MHFFCIQVVDIEEMAWAPKYGLKGVIDASMRVKVTSKTNETSDFIMPLEFKTGKATNGQVFFIKILYKIPYTISVVSIHFYLVIMQAAMEHSAQVMLYTLLMSERCSIFIL